MKILVISPKNKTLFNFRGDLIKKMISEGHTVVAIGPNQDFIEDVLELGVDFVEVPFVKDNVNILGDILYYKRLKSSIKSINPDLVFSYTIKPVIYGTLASYSVGVRRIYPMITGLGRVFASESIKAKGLRKIVGILYRMALKKSNKVIFQNNDDLNRFVNLKYLGKEKAVLVGGSGVNMNRFTANELPNSNVFLMVARVIKEKGIFEFADAARSVKSKYPKTRFILLGGLDNSIGAIQMNDIQPYIDDGSIEFPGEVKDVIRYFEASRIFVLPTYYREGLPRTILEAMAMGRPVITTDWPGCKDAVINKYNGILVRPKDEKQLFDAMISMIENPKIAIEYGMRSLERCRDLYEISKVNEDMLQIMELRSCDLD